MSFNFLMLKLWPVLAILIIIIITFLNFLYYNSLMTFNIILIAYLHIYMTLQYVIISLLISFKSHSYESMLFLLCVSDSLDVLMVWWVSLRWVALLTWVARVIWKISMVRVTMSCTVSCPMRHRYTGEISLSCCCWGPGRATPGPGPFWGTAVDICTQRALLIQQ